MSNVEKLLITGATGFLGGAVASALVRASKPPAVLFAVRAGTPGEGLSRLRHNLAKFALPIHFLRDLREDQIILGDLASPASLVADPRLDRVSHVVNCAAITSFCTHPKMQSTNVDGVSALAKRLAGSAALVRFLHVGTAMVCGLRDRGVVSEEWHDPHATSHAVDYTRTKLEGEQALRAVIPDARLVVARPSIVIGHTTLGCMPSGSIFWTLRIAQALGGVPFSLDAKIDVVPVDFAADALIHLALAAELAHRLYHVSAGPARSASYRAILGAMDAALGRKGSRYRELAWSEIVARRAEFPRLFGPGNARLILKAIRLYSGFAALDVTFENRRLMAEGVAAPPSLMDYVAACVETTRSTDIFAQMMSDVCGTPVAAPVAEPRNNPAELPALALA